MAVNCKNDVIKKFRLKKSCGNVTTGNLLKYRDFHVLTVIVSSNIGNGFNIVKFHIAGHSKLVCEKLFSNGHFGGKPRCVVGENNDILKDLLK